MSKIICRELNDEKVYSEKDVVLYLERFLSGSLSGDCFDGSPWGEEKNKNLYLSIFNIGDKGITFTREKDVGVIYCPHTPYVPYMFPSSCDKNQRTAKE